MRAFLLAAVLVAVATAAQADPIDDQGYLISCGDTDELGRGCTINASGFNLFVAEDGGTTPALYAKLRALPPMSFVKFSGDMGDMGDVSATLVLASFSPADDINEGNLRALQGQWSTTAPDAPPLISVKGLDWSQLGPDDWEEVYMIVPGQECADGTPTTGTSLSLYPYGSDPVEVACWQIDAIEGDALTLRRGPAGAAVDYTRQK